MVGIEIGVGVGKGIRAGGSDVVRFDGRIKDRLGIGIGTGVALYLGFLVGLQLCRRWCDKPLDTNADRGLRSWEQGLGLR